MLSPGVILGYRFQWTGSCTIRLDRLCNNGIWIIPGNCSADQSLVEGVFYV